MGIYLNEDNHIFTLGYVERAPVAGKINAPLASTIPRERMIAEYGMEGVLKKQISSFFEPLFEFRMEFCKLLLKISMQFYLHSY